jgi:hypothetical protein
MSSLVNDDIGEGLLFPSAYSDRFRVSPHPLAIVVAMNVPSWELRSQVDVEASGDRALVCVFSKQSGVGLRQLGEGVG